MEITSILPFKIRTDVFHVIHQNPKSLMIMGPEGSGKSSLARWIHKNGPRSHKPYLQAKANETFESIILRANAGTVYFEPSIAQNEVFLRKIKAYIENGFITHPFNPKIQILALSQIVIGCFEGDSEQLSESDNDCFKPDVFTKISLPALDSRKSEFPMICRVFVLEAAREYNKAFVRNISSKCIQELQKRNWPGGLRELRETLNTAVQFCTESEITFIPEVSNFPGLTTKELENRRHSPENEMERRLPPNT